MVLPGMCKARQSDRTCTKGGYQKTMTVVIICMIVLFLLVLVLFVSIGGISEEVKKMKTLNSFLIHLSLAKVVTDAGDDEESREINEILKKALQKEDKNGRN